MTNKKTIKQNHTNWISGLFGLFHSKKSASGIEIEGHYFDGRIKLGSHILILNGAGVREVNGKKLYALGLYLPAKAKQEKTAKALLGARRAQLAILSKLDANNFINSLRSAIEENNNETAKEFIKEELLRIENFMKQMTNLDPGDIVNIDWLPSRGTFVYYNGQLIDKPLRGKALYDAIISIWLGNNAIQDDLKDDLLKLKSSSTDTIQ